MMVSVNRINIFRLLQKALEEFRKNDPLRMAGATAFFTTFALPAVLIILIQVFGLVLNPRFMSRQLFSNLGEVTGRNTAIELHKTLFNVRLLFRNWYEAALGFLFLIFVATTLLKVVKDSLNQLWNIRTLQKMGFGFGILTRVKSFLVILIAGVLFLVVLLAEAGLDLAQNTANGTLIQHGVLAKTFIRQIILLVIVTAWFSMLFKF